MIIIDRISIGYNGEGALHLHTSHRDFHNCQKVISGRSRQDKESCDFGSMAAAAAAAPADIRYNMSSLYRLR